MQKLRRGLVGEHGPVIVSTSPKGSTGFYEIVNVNLKDIIIVNVYLKVIVIEYY